METAAYFEMRALRGVTIVNPASAHPQVGREPAGLDEGHISIAKPRAKGDQVCGAARELLRDYLLTGQPGLATAAAAASGSRR